MTKAVSAVANEDEIAATETRPPTNTSDRESG